jgi:hypothetical protein
MDRENLLTQLMQDSLTDAASVARHEWGARADQTAVVILAAALFSERARVGTEALERAVFGRKAT